jgi:carbon-monoxide dehydrogenase large subunit
VWAARQLKRSVKWTSTRGEGFQSDVQGRDHVAFAEMAMDKDGHFLGLRVTNYACVGAYLSNMIPFIATGGNAMLVGLYKTPAIYVNVKGVVTNTVPIDAYRGAGRPEAAYLVERLVDAAAREVGLSPDEIRRRNFIPPEAMPYLTPLDNMTYDSGEFQAVMEEAMKNADWDGFEKRRAESKKNGKLRGIGMATYIERCGGGAPETAKVRFNDDDTLTIYIGTQDNGQGHTTSYKQIMSQALDIDADKINIVQGDTDVVPAGFTGGSRSVPVGGAAVLGAGDEIRDKGKAIAAHLMEVADVDVEYADGVYTVAGTDKKTSLFEVAKAAKEGNVPEGVEGDLDTDYTRHPEAATFPNGCHIVELEVDPDTGAVDLLRYTVVDDFGEVINPIMLQGQVHGGCVQGIGQALHEYSYYNPESGQLEAGSFMDYDMPKADSAPMFDFDTHNVRCTTNPLGIKGAGEAGAIGAPPAIINGIVDALIDEYGITHIDMPATAVRVWQAIQDADKGKKAA